MSDEIRCGKCNTGFHPRRYDKSDQKSTLIEIDYTCPVCSYNGRAQEGFGGKNGKTILKD